jgi:asparagine synthase (glutamine-hydrolysing)
MCGICGFAGRADEPLAASMAELIQHRGPDGQGVRAFEGRDGRPPATLGHRRLTIIDPTERGAQPMGTPDGRYWITYNGEVYNFLELRAELERDGVKFHSDCDTEVVLQMYARHGPASLNRLNGIYAFAIWDDEAGELFLARDRLGIKPLYWAQHDGALYFASEVKAMLPALPPARLRESAVAEYLSFLWVPDPDTMFEDIQMLPQGHYALWRDGRLDIKEWWDMTFAPEDGRGGDEWARLVRDEVADSVTRQKLADVPIGAFLSGGVDSSAIVADLAATTKDPVTTYTVGFTGEDLRHEATYDDVTYARQVAQQFKAEYNERILTPDIVDLLPKLIWHMDEPVADAAAVNTYLICSAAREKLTVVLSGMGGDEIFAGYPRYLAAQYMRLADPFPRGLRRRMRTGLEGRLTMGKPGRLRGPRRNLMKMMRGIDQPLLERHLVYRAYYRTDELEPMLSTELRAGLRDHDPFDGHRTHLDRVRDEHWLNQLLYVDMKTFLPCLNLMYTDKMGMAASTEVRVPLLDNEMVELSSRVPPQLKLRGTKRKYVLKKAMEGTLTKDVIWRPKAGFSAPLRAWMAIGGPLRPMIDDLLSPETVRSRGLFEPAEVQRIIKANDAGIEDNAQRIYTLLTLELWQRQFTDGPA